jgi:hypothetical protein
MGGQMSCQSAAEALVVRAAALGHRGRKFTAKERKQLVAAIPVYPAWLLELLSSVPLCGLWLGCEDPSTYASGQRRTYEVQWLEVAKPDLILRECLEAYPGIGLLSGGYVNFGGNDGSGNPYFVPANKGDDPPLYRCDHETSGDAEKMLLEGGTIIAARLTDFFNMVMLKPKGENP